MRTWANCFCRRYTERTKEEREKLMETLVRLMNAGKVRVAFNAKSGY